MYHYDIKGNEIRKDFWYGFTLFVLVMISGLRYRIGGDTINYMYSYYHQIPYIWEISFIDIDALPFEPLYCFFCSVVKSLGVKFFVFQFLHAIFVNGLILAYIKKHGDYPFTCVLFYFIWMYALYNFEEMRSSMSLAVCLYANDYLIEKKWIKCFLLFIVGCLFHYSTILLLITPLLLFLRMNIIGGVFLMLAFLAGFILQKNFGDYLMLLDLNSTISDRAYSYTQQEFYFESRTSLRGFIIGTLPYFIYAVLSSKYLKKYKTRNSMKESGLLRFQPFFMIGMIFVLISVPMPISYRYVRFYILYFILFFSNYFVGLIRYNGKLAINLALLRAFVIFLPLFNIISHIYRDPIRESSNTKKFYPYEKYIPYSSVIEKSTSDRREKLFSELESVSFSVKPMPDEY